MSDSSNSNFDNTAFVSGFIGENADGSADYLFGRFTRWYLAQRPTTEREESDQESAVDELAEQRLLRQIAQNHAAKIAGERASPTSRTPRLAIAASVAVAALGLALFMASPNDPLNNSETVRGHAPQQAVAAGTITDLEAAKRAVRSLGAPAEIGHTLELDSVVDPFAPEYAALKDRFSDGETIYFLRVTVDDAADIEALRALAKSVAPFTGLNRALEQQEKKLVLVDGSTQELIYLFRLQP